MQVNYALYTGCTRHSVIKLNSCQYQAQSVMHNLNERYAGYLVKKQIKKTDGI